MKLKIAALGAKGIPHPGGIELVMEEIGSRLVQRGHRFDIFVRDHYMAEKPFLKYKGVGLPRSRGFHHKNLDALTHSTMAFPRIFSEQYDVVYLNSVGLSTLAWLPRLFGKRVVVHTHGLDWKREKWGSVAKKLIRMSAWSSVALPHLTFCVCLEDKRFLEGMYKKKCHYIPNGIPHVRRRGVDRIKSLGLKRGDYFLFMARLVPEKGAHFLLEAWMDIPAEDKVGRKLVIAGGTNHEDTYYHRLMKYDRFDDVVFTGFATGALKEELLSNALCFVQPSTIEGMPLSLLEAMGYARMILASDIQENKDVLGGHGWNFKSGTPGDLSKKLLDICRLPHEVIKEEGQSAHEFGMKTYNWDRITDDVEERLNSLFSKKRG